MSKKTKNQDELPACGPVTKIITEPEESAPKTGDLLPPSGNGGGSGLQVMSEKDVNDYMTALMSVQKPPGDLSSLETTALTNFRQISIQQGNAERSLTRAQTEVERLKAEVSRFRGQSEAYAQLLISAEDARRANQ